MTRALRKLLEPLRPESVETHRDPVETRVAQRSCPCSKHDAVRRHRQITDRSLGRDQAQQLRKLSSQERFTPGDANLTDTDQREHIDQTAQLVEREDVAAGQPGVLILRHAIPAPKVAAVRDRQAQIAQWATKRVHDPLLDTPFDVIYHEAARGREVIGVVLTAYRAPASGPEDDALHRLW